MSAPLLRRLSLAALLLIGGCGTATEPGAVPANETAPSPVLPDARQLAELIDDAIVRNLPALSDDPAREQLDVSLAQLAAALRIGSAGPIKRALADARAAALRYPSRFADEALEPDLDALQLALDVVTQHLAELGK
ncbi:MAG: hypothetical protein HOP28_15420 [Gemmatimonadales bacterium]|nr:hypothetical protein [Gemmatimonadales bacterium]